MQDNALAKALIRQGHDALLIPTYTPIQTDEPNVSSKRLFYGGLNVYLEQSFALFRWLPRWGDQLLSSPTLVGWIANRAMGTSATKLGALTVSMLRGMEGRQRKEVIRLCAWLKTEKSDVVVFSNLLIAGCLSELKRQLSRPVVVILQGDDIFFNSLIEPYRDQALTELRNLAAQVDHFIVHSHDYGGRMRNILGIPEGRLSVVPLAIDTHDYVEWEREPARERPPTVGYLARLAPEKGLHLLVDAFIELRRRYPLSNAQLAIAGWLGNLNQTYWSQQQEKLSAAGLAEQYHYFGSVDRPAKLKFLKSIDVLSVPTVSLEPKGLFVLEGLAAGVPFVQPAHGAFPELFELHGGGHLFDPQQPEEYVEGLGQLLFDRSAAEELGQRGRASVLGKASTTQQAQDFVAALATLVDSAT